MKKTVFISGSTRGIGRAIALRFAQKKYLVILHGQTKTKQSELLLKEIKNFSEKSAIYYFDITKKKEVNDNCQKIMNRFGTVDILINNAGIVKNSLFTKMTYADFDKVIKTNLYSLFFITKQFLPRMIDNNWGRIINMSSISALIGDYGQTNYSASKAAVLGFSKSLAKEVAKYNVTVNSVCPGLVDTDILKNVPKKYLDFLLAKIPLKRMAAPAEIADLVLFLASHQSDYITGEFININGGWF